MLQSIGRSFNSLQYERTLSFHSRFVRPLVAVQSERWDSTASGAEVHLI
jgi:hypothetical protein